MKVAKMEKGVNSENHLTSAAAFVEGGIQESCDDACSICLEPFSESDPSTITGCKHEFHLQCILEWCQRSSWCPMCWQPISLKDPSSQELLDAIEQEKIVRASPSRNTTIFHHPTLGDFELQHLPATRTDAELEERILQHLAAAAAMGRVRHIARREGQRSRSSAQGRPHFVMFSTAPNAPPVAPLPSSPTHRGEAEPAAAVTLDVPTSPLMVFGEDSTQLVTQPSTHCGTSSNNQRSTSQSSPTRLDGAGPSDFQSFSESLKSRFNAISMRYKESVTKSTRSWKERLFSRSTNTADLGSDLSREVNAGIATVPHLVERLEIRDNSETNIASILNDSPDFSVPDPGNQQIAGQASSNCLKEGNIQAPCVTSFASD